jgi:beta-glucosidase
VDGCHSLIQDTIKALVWYDHKYTETVDTKFGNTAFQPQWEFGHGLSYSTISYSAVTLSADTVKGDDSLIIQVTVKNTGNFDVLEPVLLFVTDQYASVTPAVRKLIDFKKVSVRVQSSQLVTFSISKEDLQFVGSQMQWIVEEGSFDLTIGGKTASFYYKP